MLTETLGPLAEQRGVTDAVEVAVTAVARQIDWLADTAIRSTPVPRLSVRSCSKGCSPTTWTPTSTSMSCWRAAEDDLDRTLDELASVAARFRRGTMADRSVVSAAFEEMADDSCTPDTVLDLADASLRAAADFVSARNLMTVPALDIRVLR
ncbi:MAG: hypothetical protein U0R64_03010 [Candidatus Nanopelagicales bacterium]